MSVPFPVGFASYTQAFGTAPAGVQFPIYVTAAPTSTFTQGPLGVLQPGQKAVWINNAVYELLGFTSTAGVLSANWVEVASSSGDVLSVTGTANQITSSPTTGNVVLSIPSTFIAPGSIAATTTVTAGTGITATTGNITATAGNLVATAGNLSLNGAASKISVSAATPASASVGTTAALTAGSIVVSTTAITANSLVFFSTNTLGTVTVPQAYRVSARTPGVSFTIQSQDATDTSTVNYWIIN